MVTRDHIAKLEGIIGYKFHNIDDISVALFHPGLCKGNKKATQNFERLEFLGDRVLGLSLATFLYENFKNDTEGELAVRMATLAGTDLLIHLAKQTKIIDCFAIPKDFFISVNKTSSSIADMMEAVFGAVYLDSDFLTVKSMIQRLWKDDINKVIYKEKDAKTRLQEMVQQELHELPVYRLVKMSGEIHDPVFEVEVIAGKNSAIGYGNSKKSAEHDAAKRMILQLQELKN